MKWLIKIVGLIFFLATPALAQENPAHNYNTLDTSWVLTAAFLVFFMQAGFNMESYSGFQIFLTE